MNLQNAQVFYDCIVDICIPWRIMNTQNAHVFYYCIVDICIPWLIMNPHNAHVFIHCIVVHTCLLLYCCAHVFIIALLCTCVYYCIVVHTCLLLYCCVHVFIVVLLCTRVYHCIVVAHVFIIVLLTLRTYDVYYCIVDVVDYNHVTYLTCNSNYRGKIYDLYVVSELCELSTVEVVKV